MSVSIPDWFPKTPTLISTIISIVIGIICEKSGFLIETYSAKKLEVKEPIKKQILNTLNLRHVSLMKQLQDTANQIESKKEEN